MQYNTQHMKIALDIILTS